MNNIVADSHVKLISIARVLREEALAAETLGMIGLADNLTVKAKAIQEVANNIHDEWGKEIGRQFQETQQSSLNMLNGALAAVEISKTNQ